MVFLAIVLGIYITFSDQLKYTGRVVSEVYNISLVFPVEE